MTSQFHLGKRDLDAIAYDELLSYVETTGDEGALDDEEMPNGKLRWTLGRLRQVLDRYAHYEFMLTTPAGQSDD